LNTNGSTKPDDEILKLSKQWSSKFWNDYLDAISVSQSEQLLDDPNSIEFFTEDACRLILGIVTSGENYTSLQSALMILIEQLSSRERSVIYEGYWNGKNNVEIAQDLQIRPDSVKKTKKRAIAKLRVLMNRGQIFECAGLASELSRIDNLLLNCPPLCPPSPISRDDNPERERNQ